MSAVQPRFSCIYCDDVREEARGKLSFMGVYNGTLLFNQFPGKLASLSVVLKLAYPLDEIITDLKFEVADGEGMEITLDVPQDDLKKQQAAIEQEEDARVHLISTILRLPEIEFNKKTIIRATCTVNGESMQGDGLIVKTYKEL